MRSVPAACGPLRDSRAALQGLHGSLAPSPPPRVTAPIRLVRASFVLDLWQRGETIPPRQQMPEGAFYDGLPAAAEIVAISCAWLTDEHPDPWGDALAAIGPPLQ